MLGRVQWQLQPWRLGWGTPLTLTSEWGDQVFTGRMGIGLSGLSVLRDVSVNLDTRALREIFPLYLGGTLSGNFDRIEVEQLGLGQAQGTLYLRNAAWTANSGNIPLGDYRIDVSGAASSADGIVGTVVTEGGALALDGSIPMPMQSNSARVARWRETTVFDGRYRCWRRPLPRALTLPCKGSCKVVIRCVLT